MLAKKHFFLPRTVKGKFQARGYRRKYRTETGSIWIHLLRKISLRRGCERLEEFFPAQFILLFRYFGLLCTKK